MKNIDVRLVVQGELLVICGKLAGIDCRTGQPMVSVDAIVSRHLRELADRLDPPTRTGDNHDSLAHFDTDVLVAGVARRVRIIYARQDSENEKLAADALRELNRSWEQLSTILAKGGQP